MASCPTLGRRMRPEAGARAEKWKRCRICSDDVDLLLFWRLLLCFW
jgi:hypothetical protein